MTAARESIIRQLRHEESPVTVSHLGYCVWGWDGINRLEFIRALLPLIITGTVLWHDDRTLSLAAAQPAKENAPRLDGA